MTDESPSSVVLLCVDLMLESQAEAAAARAGCKLITTATAEAAVHAIQAQSAHTLIVDLTVKGVDLTALKQSLEEQQNLKFVAFGPHVHERKLEAAKDAGFDAVLSRGQFHSQMHKWMMSPNE